MKYILILTSLLLPYALNAMEEDNTIQRDDFRLFASFSAESLRPLDAEDAWQPISDASIDFDMYEPERPPKPFFGLIVSGSITHITAEHATVTYFVKEKHTVSRVDDESRITYNLVTAPTSHTITLPLNTECSQPITALGRQVLAVLKVLANQQGEK